MEIIAYACSNYEIYRHLTVGGRHRHNRNAAVVELAYIDAGSGSRLPSQICEHSSRVIYLSAISDCPEFEHEAGWVPNAEMTAVVYPDWSGVENACRRDLIFGADADTLPVAEYFATLAGREFAGLWCNNDIAANSLDEINSVTVIGLYQSISHAQVRDISVLAEKLPTGVIPGRNVELLSQIVAWNILNTFVTRQSYGSHVSLNDMEMADFYADGNWITASFDEDDSLPDFGGQKYDFLSFGGHGGPVDMSIAPSTILCGLRREVVVNVGDIPHTCQVTGQCSYDPHGAKHRVSIEALACKVLFLRTCTGVGIGKQKFSADLLLSAGALESGVLSYISAIKQVSVPDSSAVVMSLLHRNGFSSGEAVEIISAVEAHPQGGRYLLLGDPLYKTQGKGISSAIHQVQLSESFDSTKFSARFQVGQFTGMALVDLILPATAGRDVDLAEGQFSCAAMQTRELVTGKILESEVDRGFTTIFRSRGKLYFLFCYMPLSASFECVVEIVPTVRKLKSVDAYPELGHRLSDIVLLAGAMNLRAGRPQYDMSSDAGGGPVLLELAAASRQILRNWFGQLLAGAPRGAKSEPAFEAISILQQKAIKDIDSWGLPVNFSVMLADLYAVVDEKQSEQSCPICESRPTDFVVKSSPFYPGRNRHGLNCRCCSYVAEGELGLRAPVVKMQATQGFPGDVISVDVEYENSDTASVAFAANLYFERRIPWNHLACVSSDAVGALVLPGETMRGRFEIKVPDQATPGLYKVTLFYFLDLSFGAICFTVNVLPGMSARLEDSVAHHD